MNNASKIKVSIIVPIYNAGKYLQPALESVQSQTFTDFECICVNDGSRDNSADVVSEFIQNDSRFILINQENGGVARARNTGLDAARGEYITFLDQDDLIAPDALEIYFDMATEYNADIVRARYKKVQENFNLNGYQLGKNFIARFFTNPKSDFINVVHDKKYKIWAYIWVCLFKRDVIKNIRFIPGLRSGGEDNMFMAQVIDKISNFVQTDNVALFHKKSDISTTLNGFKPVLIERFLVTTPLVHQNYVIKNCDDIWSKYIARKETRSIYYVVKRCIFKNQHIKLAQKIFGKLHNENLIQTQYLDYRQKLIFKLFLGGYEKLLRIFKWAI